MLQLKDNNGCTPMHSLIGMWGNGETAKGTIEAIVESLDAEQLLSLLQLKDNDGRTPMHSLTSSPFLDFTTGKVTGYVKNVDPYIAIPYLHGIKVKLGTLPLVKLLQLKDNEGNTPATGLQARVKLNFSLTPTFLKELLSDWKTTFDLNNSSLRFYKQLKKPSLVEDLEQLFEGIQKAPAEEELSGDYLTTLLVILKDGERKPKKKSTGFADSKALVDHIKKTSTWQNSQPKAETKEISALMNEAMDEYRAYTSVMAVEANLKKSVEFILKHYGGKQCIIDEAYAEKSNYKVGDNLEIGEKVIKDCLRVSQIGVKVAEFFTSVDDTPPSHRKK